MTDKASCSDVAKKKKKKKKKKKSGMGNVLTSVTYSVTHKNHEPIDFLAWNN